MVITVTIHIARALTLSVVVIIGWKRWGPQIDVIPEVTLVVSTEHDRAFVTFTSHLRFGAHCALSLVGCVFGLVLSGDTSMFQYLNGVFGTR